MVYAADTKVPVERTRGEIEKLLLTRGASQFVAGWDGSAAMIAFVLERQYRFTIPIPRDAPKGMTVSQLERSRWRTLLLVIKAKLESVDCGLTTFEQEFLANVVLPDGTTVYENVAPKIKQAYLEGRVRPLLELERSL